MPLAPVFSVTSDLRYAVRSLRKAPGFTSVGVLTLALGMAATTAIYTLLDRIVLDPLPYPESERLVHLRSAVPTVGKGVEWNLSAAEFFHFGREAGSIEQIGAYQVSDVNVQTPDGPDRASSAVTTAGMLQMLGAHATLGRLIDPTDDHPSAPLVVMLSHGYWETRFGADPAIIGKALTINDRPFEVIGVMAPGVELPLAAGATQLWWPMGLNPSGPFYNDHGIPVIARLRPGVTFEQAQAELDALTRRLPEVFPRVYSQGFMERTGFRTVVYPLKAHVVGSLARNLWILLGGVGLVLLIAATNVANLFLVRIEGRRREIALRVALGAGRGAIARQLFAEGLVLTVAAGVLALLIAYWSVDFLTAVAPRIPRLEHLRIDAGVLIFTFAVSVALAGSLAVLPAAHRRPFAPSGPLVDGSRSMTAGRERQRLRGTLVVVQMALALVLVVGSGLLFASLRRLKTVDSGIDPEGVLTLQLSLPSARYRERETHWRFYRDLIERVTALPGVSRAGVAGALPLTGSYGFTLHGFEDPGVLNRLRDVRDPVGGALVPATPGYLEALRIPLLEGRTFTNADNDDPSRGVAIVSRAFAERYWPGESPIGKGVRPFNSGTAYYRVVGVVGDVPATSVDAPSPLAIYYPIVAIPGQPTWWLGGRMFVVVRTELDDPMALLPSIRRSVLEIDPTIPVANAETMQAVVDRSMIRLSFTMVLLGIAAAVALVLAALGLYGVISYVVARRTNEIGVRIALGARPADVQRLVVRGSLLLAAFGLGAGTLGALAFTRVLRGLLFGVGTTHAAAYVGAALLLLAVALLASWVPARRAARVDPMVAIRHE